MCYINLLLAVAFSALTLLVGWQKWHPACKKTERWGAGVVTCLERGADLHMAQLMPLPLTVSCFSKIQTVCMYVNLLLTLTLTADLSADAYVVQARPVLVTAVNGHERHAAVLPLRFQVQPHLLALRVHSHGRV